MSDSDLKFQNLPEDVLFNVLSYLTAKDLCRLSCVSNRFYILSNDEYFWRRKLLTDSKHWKSLGSAANPEFYISRYSNEMPSKEIYLRCCPNIQEFFSTINSFSLNDVFTRLKSFFYKVVPKIALMGPGLESDTQCFVRNLMCDSSVNPLKFVKMFPGYAGGIGTGFTYELKTISKSFARQFDMSIIYSTTENVRTQKENTSNRMANNKLFQSTSSDVFKLTSQASDFFFSMDALIYVVDANVLAKSFWELAKIELYSITQHMWVKPHIPILILSLALNDTVPRKLSCLNVIDRLDMNSLNGRWQVINSTVMDMAKVDEAFEWVLHNCRA